MEGRGGGGSGAGVVLRQHLRSSPRSERLFSLPQPLPITDSEVLPCCLAIVFRHDNY